MKKILPWIAAIVTVAIWAETFVSTKILLNNGLQPPDIFFYRFILAYIAIWFISPKTIFADNRKDELLFVLLGITGGSLYFLTENTALEYSTASNVAILVGCAPLLTAIIVSFFYKEEKLKVKQIIGSVISIIGMTLVVLNGKFVLHINPLGDAMAIGAALLWALYTLLLRKISDRYDVIFTTRKIFAYGLLTMAIFLLTVNPLSLNLDIIGRPVVWGNLFYLGIVASLLCFLMWNWALVKLGSIRTTNLIYGQCLFTMVIAAAVLGEIITPMAIIGSVLLIFGMILAVRKQSPQ